MGKENNKFTHLFASADIQCEKESNETKERKKEGMNENKA